MVSTSKNKCHFTPILVIAELCNLSTAFKSYVLFDLNDQENNYSLVASTEPSPIKNHLCKLCHILILLESLVSFGNFEIIRGSLMRPNWPKLASLPQKTCTLLFQFFDAVFAFKG